MATECVKSDLTESTTYSAIGWKAKPLSLAFLLGAAIAMWTRMLWSAEPSPAPELPTSEQITERIHIRSASELHKLREATVHAAFGGPLPQGEPTAEAVGPPFPAVRHAARFPGDGYFLANEHPNGALALYHSGHGTRVLEEGMQTIQAMLAAGYDVLALSMPPEPHAQYHSLRPFLEPVALAVNYATRRTQYREIVMVGLSGGGWTTVVYAALDPRIDRSYPIAGSLPMIFRTEAKDVADFEQQLPGLPVSYFDLYLMAASDGRQQVQVFNREDPCCFAGTKAMGYRNDVAARAEALGGDFDVLIAENDQHSLQSGLLRMMFPQRPHSTHR